MVPVLPVINQPPPHRLFVVLEFLPFVFCYLVLLLLIVSAGIILPLTYFCYRRQIITVRRNSKIQRLVVSCYHKLEKLNVLIFPRLFTEKKLKSGTKEWKEILFLDKRWPEYQGSKNPKTHLMVLFASLGMTIICISALGFFRHFPVTTGGECLERDNNFNTWYCYDNTSSEPLDCEEYVSMNESFDSITLRCYAFSLDIGTSSAVAFGLYNLCSLVIFGIVFPKKIFYRMCQKCKMPVACSVYCYSVTIFIILFIVALFLLLLVYVFFIDQAFPINGEFMYRLALPLFLFIFAGCALSILLRMHRYGVDTWRTYNCLATEDEEAEVELTPRIANDRTDCTQYTAFEEMTL